MVLPVRHVFFPPHLFRFGFPQRKYLFLIPDNDILCMLDGMVVGWLVEATVNVISCI